MKQKTSICEYEELIKAKMFFMEGQREFHDFTFEKIKRGLSSEYLGNINEKIERWIDITHFQYFRKARPVEYYMLVKMLYRDGFYESAIITARSICEMICYDILKTIDHPFGNENEISLVNFRTLLRFICIPKAFSNDQFETEFLSKISRPQDNNIINSLFKIDPKSKRYSIDLKTAKKPVILNKFFSICSELGFAVFDNISKVNYDKLNDIYDLGNAYVHASQKSFEPKKDARQVIMNIGEVLFDTYGIGSIEDLTKREVETAYQNYPDICSGINFAIEVFASPEDAMRGYYNVPSESFLLRLKNTVGKWNGKWTCHGTIIEDAELSIALENDHLKASIKYSSTCNETRVNVMEECGIKFFHGYFHMQGYKTTLEPPVDEAEYANDFFELEFLGDDILVGLHRCRLGDGKTVFLRA